MKLSLITLYLSCLLYFLAFAMHLFSFWGVRFEKRGNQYASVLMRVGFLLSTFFFVSSAIDYGSFLPVLNFSQAMAFFGWCLAFVYLIFLVRIQTESFGLVLTPILLLLTAVASLTYVESGIDQVKTLQLNPYFKLHIVSAFFAYASFTLSFAAGLLYLIQNHELKAKKTGTFYHKLPPLGELEKLVCRPLFWGIPLLGVTIVVGFLWSKSAYGEYWIFDPKTIATAVTALLYAAILSLRSASALRGRQVAVLSVIAFTIMIFSFVGTRFIEGSHNYLQ